MTDLAPWSYPLLALLPLVLVLVIRPAPARPGIGLAVTPGLLAAARRTSLMRLLLAVAICGAVTGVALGLRAPRTAIGQLVPGGTTTMVVLDMSASVSDLVYDEIARTLGLISSSTDESARVGLILFSDVAQEALPPGVRASELDSFRRFFLPLRDPDERPRPALYRQAGPADLQVFQYIVSPWYSSFGGGTAISTGLRAAREALERDRVEGRVLLVSDLDDRASDTAALTRELLAYSASNLELDVIGVPPAVPAQVQLIERVMRGSTRVVRSAELRGSAGTAVRGPAFPTLAVTLIAVLALAVAWFRVSLAPLAWGTGRPRP